MQEAVLTTQNLSKKYGSVYALENCSLTIEKGQIYGLVGKNGAGKTTLMRLICGQSLPTGGTVCLFGGSDKKALVENRKRIGCMIETPVFYPNFSAKKNLTLYCIKKGIPVRGQIEEVLQLVGLSDAGDKQFNKFSLGMKERLGIALALLGVPELLILDEPTNGLDPVGIAEIRSLLLKLNKERGVTILLSSHILREMSMLATHYGFIDNGKMIAEMSANELNERCKNSLVVQVSNTTSACVVLERICGSKNYRILTDGKICIYDHIDNPAQINRELMENGIEVYASTVEGKDLEGFFIELIGEDKKQC